MRAFIEDSHELVLLRADFRLLSSPSQVSRALNSLIDEGRLVRVGAGVYVRTRRSSVTNALVPAGSLETVAAAALKRLGINAGPGAAAQRYNRRESNQLPGAVVAHTGKRRITRSIVVGGQKLQFENSYVRSASPATKEHAP